MYAKYFHGDMAFQTKVVFLGVPVYNSVDVKLDKIMDSNFKLVICLLAKGVKYSSVLKQHLQPTTNHATYKKVSEAKRGANLQ